MAKNKGPPSKRQLEIQLAKLEVLESPSLGLEQYPVSAEVASELLYMAGFEHNDLAGDVVDLGTGTGRLAIGAALMGAKQVIGVDIDRKSIATAIRNQKKTRVEADWLVGDLDSIQGRFTTVLMNPPYGTRTPHQDVRFLSRAFSLAPVTYSIHKSSTRRFLTQFAEKKGRRVDEVRSMTMTLPHLFNFHAKKRKDIAIDLYRIT